MTRHEQINWLQNFSDELVNKGLIKEFEKIYNKLKLIELWKDWYPNPNYKEFDDKVKELFSDYDIDKVNTYREFKIWLNTEIGLIMLYVFTENNRNRIFIHCLKKQLKPKLNYKTTKMKISDFKEKEKFREFLKKLSHFTDLKELSGIRKSIMELNHENFYFHVVDKLGELMKLNIFDSEDPNTKITENLHKKTSKMKKSEITSFVLTNILFSDINGYNIYEENFYDVIPEVFGIRPTLEKVKEKYDLFNELYFYGSLPHSSRSDIIKFEFHRKNAVNTYGTFVYRWDIFEQQGKDFTIKINPNYKFHDEVELDGILIHEMIHFYNKYVQNDYSRVNQGHTWNFCKMCDIINEKTDNKYKLQRYNNRNHSGRV